MSGFDFLVKNNFSWKMISAKQRFKQKKICSCHAQTKHELSHSTVKISKRKATSSGLYKTVRNSIYIIKHWKSSADVFLCPCGGTSNNCAVCNLIITTWKPPKQAHWLIFFKRESKAVFKIVIKYIRMNACL